VPVPVPVPVPVSVHVYFMAGLRECQRAR